MLKINLQLEGTKEQMASQCLEFVQILAGGKADAEARETAKTEPAKRGRKPKADKEPEPLVSDEPDFDEEPSADEEQEESFEEDFSDEPEEDENETVNEEELKKLKQALAAFSAKNSKQAAIKVLIKYGKTSSEVKRKDLPELLKKLAVKK